MSPITIPFHHNYIRRGRGLGGILKSIGSVIKPFLSQTKTILKPIGREIGREGLSLLSNFTPNHDYDDDDKIKPGQPWLVKIIFNFPSGSFRIGGSKSEASLCMKQI